MFGGVDAKGIFRLWMRSLDSLETTRCRVLKRNGRTSISCRRSSGRRTVATIAFFSAGKTQTDGPDRWFAASRLRGARCRRRRRLEYSGCHARRNTAGGLVRCPAGGGTGNTRDGSESFAEGRGPFVSSLSARQPSLPVHACRREAIHQRAVCLSEISRRRLTVKARSDWSQPRSAAVMCWALPGTATCCLSEVPR